MNVFLEFWSEGLVKAFRESVEILEGICFLLLLLNDKYFSQRVLL